MIKEFHRELTQSIIRADDPQKAINNLARILNTSKNNAGRLIMTETAAVSSTAQKDCFDELDVEEFEIVATLDGRTSEICRKMDGKHFPMSQYEIGVTAPPFHVRCRTVTVPYFEDDYGAVGQRATRGEDGKTYYVPADMTYREWEQKFVKKEQTEQREKADYLIRANTPGQNITKERKNHNLISEYQGRIYVDDIFAAFNSKEIFRDDLLWEFISESFREYIENPNNLKKKSAELYNFIKGAVE